MPPFDENAQWRLVSELTLEDMQILLRIYSTQPRPYQTVRTPSTLFQQWVRWEWENDAAIVCQYEHDQGHGYIVIGKADSETDVFVLEWRAPNLIIEQKLLCIAVAEIQRRHEKSKIIRLFALPQYMTIVQLGEWAGPVQINTNSDSMMRNIRLSDGAYEKIKAAFCDGHATFWSGDYF